MSTDALFKEEKEPERTLARCHLSLEKSSKNYIRCESEPSQAATSSVPPYPQAKRRVLEAGFPRGEAKSAKKRRHKNPTFREKVGWSADWYNSIMDWKFCAQLKMKVDSDVLLLSYLDKICLTLTGNLQPALACLYSGARLYKGPRTATHPQSTTLHSTGNISVWRKEVGHSNTCGTVRLCSFPLKFTAAQ